MVGSTLQQAHIAAQSRCFCIKKSIWCGWE